ncbi:hypothetical protein ACI51Z_13505 [Pectobacterium carotovorum]|uniref:hypothetical protein n=1 Tax=Pectobacterium TaxID=122277 RepID=UPI00068B9556|nr:MULTISPECIES: hypothetical protein [Pectobacterium]
MDHRYTRECPRPGYDEKITKWLNEQDDDDNEFGSMPYPVALYHDGFIYRSITGSGLGGYVDVCEFLKELGLVNLLSDDATFRGYDAVFAPKEVKKAIMTHKISLQDIPPNVPRKRS